MKTSENLEFYVGRGLYDIYLVKNSEREASDHIDYECEEIVARSSEGFVRVKVQTRHNCYPGKPSKRKEPSTHIIDKATYEQARSMPDAKLITGSDKESIQRQSERTRHADNLARQIDDHAPMCPVCRTKMTASESKHGPFWGCPRFKRCRTKGTPMSSDVKAKIREREALMSSALSPD